MSMPVDAQGLKTRLLWGKPIAVEIERRALQRCRELDSAGVVACLAMVYAGEYTDAARYRRAIRLRAERAGILIREIQLPDQAPASTVVEVIRRLNGDGAVHAVLLQNPLPAESRQAGLAALRPEKDVEGVTATNLGRLIQGAPSVHPCTPEAVMALIRARMPLLAGKRAVIVNRSATVGRPLAQLLLDSHATVTVCSSATVDLAWETRRAEILVVAIGRAHALGADYVGQGAVVIDVGINPDPAGPGILGDVDTQAVLPLVAAITPVPGGVGPVTTAVLIAQVIRLAGGLAGQGMGEGEP